MLKYLKSIALDVLFVAILLGTSLLLISFYFNAHFIDAGYEDWMVHAFRAKFIETYGFISWNHIWSNGNNILFSYQFIPHYITIATSKLLHVDIPRAMVLITIFIFIFLRVEMYIILRILKISSFTSFVATILTFTITQYWEGVSDYSLQFAYLCFPVVLYLWIRYMKEKEDLIFPFIVGLSLYIHPILAFFAGGLFLMGLFISDRKIISLSTLKELLVLFFTSAFFIYPVIVKDSYIFKEPYVQTKEFLGMVVSVFPYLGIGISLIGTFIISLFLSLKHLHSSMNWIKKLVFYNLTMIILIIIAINIQLPEFLSLFQFTRGAALIGISIAFTSPLVIDTLLKNGFLFKGILCLCIVLIGIEAIINISSFSPRPGYKINDPIYTYFNQKPKNILMNKRVFMQGIGAQSYLDMNVIKSPYSYRNYDSNPVSPRLGALIIYSSYTGERQIPFTSMRRIDDYFKISATDYVIFDTFSPFSIALRNPIYNLKYKKVDQIKLNDGLYDIYKTAAPSRNAVVIDPSFKNKMTHFPFNLDFSENNNFIEFDNYVHNFTNIIYSDKNESLPVIYPTQETLAVKIPESRKSNMIYIAESYGKSWKTEFNGKKASIAPVGPNYMMVTLPSEGAGILRLKHSWPSAMKFLATAVLVLPFIILFNYLFRWYLKTENKKK